MKERDTIETKSQTIWPFSFFDMEGIGKELLLGCRNRPPVRLVGPYPLCSFGSCLVAPKRPKILASPLYSFLMSLTVS